MRKPRVWVEAPIHPESLARLEEAGEVVTGGDHAGLPGSAAMLVGTSLKVDDRLLDVAGPSLVAVVRAGIGVDNIDLDAATERGVLVVNTPDAPTESTAEHTVALLLALAKRVVEGDRWLRGGRRDQVPVGLEMRERTLGLVGLGRIGERVAEICGRGLRMRLLAYDPFVSRDVAAALGVELVEELDNLLAASDVVSLHVPVTAQTRGMIDERALRRMRAGSVLVNAGRGALVDEAALVAVLREGHLSGAALDVFQTEPPPPDDALLSLPNVVATPHIAFWTDGALHAISEAVADQLLRLLVRGERPHWLVNPDAWPGRAQRFREAEG